MTVQFTEKGEKVASKFREWMNPFESKNQKLYFKYVELESSMGQPSNCSKLLAV